MRKRRSEKEELPPQLAGIHAAVWLVGLAILFYTGHIWPGILVLVAISGLVQAALFAYAKRQEETVTLATEREAHLPEKCPNCGGPLNVSGVRWQGKQSATCPWCGSTIKAIATPVP